MLRKTLEVRLSGQDKGCEDKGGEHKSCGDKGYEDES